MVVAVALLWPATAAASPQDLFGYGARMPGTGMTGVSYADDYEAVYANPAGLARARTTKVAAGLQGAGLHIELDGDRFSVEPARGMTIGFQLPIPFGGVLEDRLVIGAAFYTPATVLLEADVRFPEAPQFPVLDRSKVVAIQVGLGLDLHGLVDGLRIGVTFSALASTFGDLDVYLDETNTFRSTTQTELTASYAPIVGLSYDVGDFSLGAVYRHRSQAVNDLAINTSGLPVELPQLRVGGVVAYDPPTVALELAWQPGGGWLFAGGMELSLWNDWPGLQMRTSASSNLAPDPEFIPTVSPRLGFEKTIERGDTELWLRGGYNFEMSPAPNSRVAQNRPAEPPPPPPGFPPLPPASPEDVPLRYYDNHRHVLTAGLGFAAPLAEGTRLHFNAFGQAHWLMSRTHDIPATGEIGSDEFDAGNPAETRGYVLAGGWTLGLEF